MVNVVGIQLQKNGKIYYFDVNGLDVRPGDFVIADTARGADLGEVMIATKEIDETESPASLKKIIRIATAQDIQHGAENRAKETEAYIVCQKKIAEHGLDMKLVSVEYAFDNSKILFYFTANGRVDFRSLVKDLASVFKMRIELRQIGVRDEARMLGGLGPCGRAICCGTFLEEFQPVSIRMAKEQNLSLNPTKISGVCGRLMCCLKYEQDHYEQTRKKMPRLGREVITPDGNGTVTELNVVKETVRVRIANGDASEIKEYPLESINRIGDGGKQTVSAVAAPEVPDDESGEEETADETIRILMAEEEEIIDTLKDELPEKADRPRNKRNRNHRGGHQLGKPVRRENPNRPRNETSSQIYETQPKQEAQKTEQKETAIQEAPKSQEKKNNWAEALKKAMDAMN